MNSHPMTKANNDVEDGDSLSPFQLLMFHEGPVYFDKIVKKSHILNKSCKKETSGKMKRNLLR